MGEKIKKILMSGAKALGITTLAVGLAFAIDVVIAQGPGANPPPPIHTGSVGQTKIGGIEIIAGNLTALVGNIEANLGYVKGEELCIGPPGDPNPDRGCRDTWPGAAALECVVETAGPGEDVIVNCPSGYTVTGGGFSVGPDPVNMLENHKEGNGWHCKKSGENPSILTICYAVCCKI